MRKIMMTIGVVLLIGFIIYKVFILKTEKIVCKSEERSITIMYRKNSIVGYTAVNLDYELDEQGDYAKEIGIEKYLDEFQSFFEDQIGGTCER